LINAPHSRQGKDSRLFVRSRGPGMRRESRLPFPLANDDAAMRIVAFGRPPKWRLLDVGSILDISIPGRGNLGDTGASAIRREPNAFRVFSLRSDRILAISGLNSNDQ